MRRPLIVIATFASGLAGAVPIAPGQPPQAGALVASVGPSGWLVLHPGPFVKISAGPSTLVGLRADGSALYWNAFGGPAVAAGPFVDVSAGGPHFAEDVIIAVRTDGTPVGLIGQPFMPPPPGPFIDAIAIGSATLLRRSDGSMAAWGSCGQCLSIPTEPFTGVDAGAGLAIGIRPDGALAVWGQPGGLPAPPPGAFESVSVEYSLARHALAIRTDGTLAAWADPAVTLPQPPPGVFKSAETWDGPGEALWAIGVRADGTLIAWGQPPPSVADLPPGRYIAVATGWGSALAIAGCYADCNDDGQATVADFGCFQTQFVLGSPYADCTGEGQLTVADFGCFQTQFVLGCP